MTIMEKEKTFGGYDSDKGLFGLFLTYGPPILLSPIMEKYDSEPPTSGSELRLK